MEYYYIGGAVLLLVALVWALRPRGEEGYATAPDWEDWSEEEDVDEPAQAIPYYRPGAAYTWDQILDLVWALGYSRQEANEMWRGNYAALYRNGIRAEFDGTLMGTDKQGEPLFMCHYFEEGVVTESYDRWGRKPSADDVRKAVWR